MEFELDLAELFVGHVQKLSKSLSGSTKYTLRSLARQLALLIEAAAKGEMNQKQVKNYFVGIRAQLAMIVAMQTVLVEAQAEKFVNEMLSTVADAVNKFVGFKLIA